MPNRLKKGDTVTVISGNYKDKTGKIIRILPERNRALVSEINVVKRHTKPTPNNQQGGIIEKEASIHMSNLMLVDPKSGKPTRVGTKILEDGKRKRYAKKSGEQID